MTIRMCEIICYLYQASKNLEVEEQNGNAKGRPRVQTTHCKCIAIFSCKSCKLLQLTSTFFQEIFSGVDLNQSSSHGTQDVVATSSESLLLLDKSEPHAMLY